ncbi:MAG: type VI secretion system tip protein VgrG [Sandaracinaceae bacterium]|nr:type VI secretion system tip protein VgrG [Sandaracinaceae bacterium]
MSERLRGEWRCDEGSWRLSRLHLVEMLDEPYQATLTLVSEDVADDPRELRGRACTFTIEREAFVRPVSGIVTSVAYAGPDFSAERVECVVEVVPAFALAAQTLDTRIFQDVTVPEVLEAVLARALDPYERTWRLELSRDYPQREYTVQYEESDLYFAHRLMEEEGIAYAFEQTDEAEVLVLYDRNGAFPTLESSVGATLRYQPRRDDTGDEAAVRRVEARASLTTTSVVVRDYDFTAPSRPVEDEARGTDERGRDRERYEHARATTIGAYDEGTGRYGAHDVREQARLRREALVRAGEVLSGESDVAGMAAGRVMTLAEHPTLDGEYLVTRVTHRLRVDPHGWAAAGDYENRFGAEPFTVPYRPTRRTPAPRVPGPRLAVVTGPDGPNTTHTDVHGRIKVRFHFDRTGPHDERSSCWVRVGQPMAGPGSGHQNLPRVGSEVLVTFVGGDPDRPVVTAALPNADNAGPFHDPNDASVARMRAGFHYLTDGEGASGYNELSFLSTPDEEQIRLHAQSDLDETVRRDHVTRVERHQTQIVDGDQTETVRGDATLTVEENREKTVEGDETITVDGARTSTVRGDETERLEADRVLEIRGQETKTVTGTRTLTVRAATTEAHESGRTVTVTTDEALTVTGGLSTRVETGPLTLTQGAANHLELYDGTTIVVRTDGSVVIQVQGSRITLTPERIELCSNEILLTGGERVLAEVGGDRLELGGGRAVLQGEREACVEAGASFVATGDAASVQGTSVTINGGEVEAVAGMIKLN